jgi:hypothetical protein
MYVDRAFTPQEQDQIATTAKVPAVAPVLDSKRLTDISRRYPWVKPETLTSLARYNVSDSAVELVGQQAALRELSTYDQKKNAQGEVIAPLRYVFDGLGWIKKTARGTVDVLLPEVAEAGIRSVAQPLAKLAAVPQRPFKGAVRWISAGADIVPETVQNLASMAVGSSNYDLMGLWESTSLAVMMENFQDTGSGYFMSQTLREEQAKRARAFRGTIYGNAFTIGRGMTSWAGEGSLAYKYASGIIDAAVMLAVPDPTKYVAKGIYALGRGTKIAGGILRQIKVGEEINAALKAGGGVRGLVPLLAADDAKVVRQVLRNSTLEMRSQAGLLSELAGQSVDGTKFVQFMQSNPLAVRLVDHLVETDSAKNIMEDVFKFQVRSDTAVKLAKAKTREEVIGALTEPFTLGEGTLNANIGRYRVNQPLKFIRQSRFFTQMPKSLIVTEGTDDLENVDAIKNMMYSMRTAGVSEDRITAWADKAIESYSQRGTPTGRYEAFQEYDSAVREVLKANGIVDPVINKVMENSKAGITKLRTYMADRMGVETDNGHLAMMASILQEHTDDKVLAELYEKALTLGDDFSFAGPAQLNQLMARVRTLPDARELRRLTRNPLFQSVFNKVGLEEMGKLPLAGRRKKMEVERFSNPAKAEEMKKIIKEQYALPKAERDVESLQYAASELDKMRYVEEVRALTGDARLGIQAVDFLQNKIWKPLNLATIGYIMRNGIDAQIRMAFGGARSLVNGGVLHPLEYIHIALGLPGKGTKYAKSIAGVDMTNLGVAGRKVLTGEVIPETIAKEVEFIYVGERKFRNNRRGLNAARKYQERSGKPLIVPETTMIMDDTTARLEVQQQLAETVGLSSQRVGFGPTDEIRYGIGTGSYAQKSRGAPGSSDESDYIRGLVTTLQGYTSSEYYRRIARALQQGKAPEQIADEVADWLLSNKGGIDYRKAKSMHRHGRAYADATKTEGSFNLPVDFDAHIAAGREDVVRQVLRADILKVDLPVLEQITGNLDELKFVAAYDHFPNFTGAKSVKAEDLKMYGPRLKQAKLEVGQRVIYGEEKGIITAVDGTAEEAAYTFVPFSKSGEFLESGVLTNYAPGKTSPRMRQFLANAPLWDGTSGLPNKVRVEILKYDDNAYDLREMTTGFVNGATGFIFNLLNDVAVRKLERSPLFRQYYYQEISKHIDKLSYDEGIRLYDSIAERAAAEGVNVRQYIGEGVFQRKRVSDKIESLKTRPASTAQGKLTVQDLDDYARFKAISDTQDLLYDASTRNNFFDALRIVMPFADAWKDVVGTYAHLGARHNVNMVRQFARVYNGFEEADPDQDGRGFFFRSPTTNEVQFNFPLSGSIAKVLTGINAPLVAPVQRLSQGINIYPALGPYAQFGLSQLLGNDPKYNDLKELFLPYGETTLGELVTAPIPGTYRKAFEAFVADTENTSNTYGNVYLETLRALSVNPKYDLATEQGENDLLSDSRFKARILTGMRLVSQFLGPSAGTQEWKVPTKQGDQYVNVMLEQLRKFQTDDYDTAIDKFLNLYGDELALYVSSKSRALREGLEATQEFGDWQATNQAILDRYQRVGAYFGPVGSDFNFTVWEQQRQEKEREKLSDRELIALAQLRIGSAKYRALRKMFPPDPSDKQRQVLAAYRVQLHDELPGFPELPEFEVNKFENSLTELRDALNDSRLADNPIIGQVRRYLEVRDSLEAMDGGLSLRSKKKQKYRGYLFALGESMGQENPEFDRIWSRLLSQEVER